MNRFVKFAAAASVLAGVAAGLSQASLIDRFESGRQRVKGWTNESWPTAARAASTPMMVVSTPSGRVAYSSAFQAPGEEGAAGSVVLVPTAAVRQPTGGGVPAAIPRTLKGTYRNSR